MIRARFMLDTNTVIEIRKGNRAVVGRFLALAYHEAVMSVVSYGELLFGAMKSRAPTEAMAKIEQLSADIPVEPLSPADALAYASIRADLARRGEMIGPNDLWIAAHARSANLILVTGNEREFRRVPGLAVENWVAAGA